jgi:hypothetical protein
MNRAERVLRESTSMRDDMFRNSSGILPPDDSDLLLLHIPFDDRQNR